MKRLITICISLAGLTANAAVSQLDVMAFGARGNGTTDDTAAVQAAFNKASSGPYNLVFPSHMTFKVSRLLVTNSLTMTLEGNSRVIQDASTDTAMIRFSGSNSATLRVHGGTFDGNKAGRSAFWHSTVDNGSIIDSTNSNKRIFLEGVTFTNSVRAAVRTAGYLDVDRCQFRAPNEHDGVGLQSLGHCIYAEPTGYADGMCIRIVNSDFVATSNAAADLYKQAAGVFVTEQTGGTNKFRELIVSNNRFDGIGCMRGSQPTSPVDTYNGAWRVTILGNHVTHTAYCAFKIQRCDDALIGWNTIEDVQNSEDNTCFSIAWAPNAREGVAPFTGDRSGEGHHNFSCIGNIIRGSHRTAIYCDGDNGLIEGNIIEGCDDADDGNNLPLVVWGNNWVISGNKLHNMPRNGIWIVEATNITVSGNMVIPITQDNANTLISLNTVRQSLVSGNFLVGANTEKGPSGIWIGSSENVLVSDNIVASCTNSFDIRTSTNVVLRNNSAFNYNNPVSYNAADITVRLENNSWQPWQMRMDTNGLSYFSVQNGFTNTSARALLEVLTHSSGGYIAAYPTNYTDSDTAGRVVIGANSGTYSLDALIESDQSWRVRSGSTILNDVNPHRTVIAGDYSAPAVVNSSSAVATFLSFQNQGDTKSYIGWNPAFPGFIVLDATGAFYNLRSDDATGDLWIRGGLTLSGPISGITEMNIDTLNIGTIGLTNSMIYKPVADGPSAVTIGAGNAAIWLSNSVPAQFFVRTSDGATTTDTPFP